jgi:hypothetical protein
VLPHPYITAALLREHTREMQQRADQANLRQAARMARRAGKRRRGGRWFRPPFGVLRPTHNAPVVTNASSRTVSPAVRLWGAQCDPATTPGPPLR